MQDIWAISPCVTSILCIHPHPRLSTTATLGEIHSPKQNNKDTISRYRWVGGYPGAPPTLFDVVILFKIYTNFDSSYKQWLKHACMQHTLVLVTLLLHAYFF